MRRQSNQFASQIGYRGIAHMRIVQGTMMRKKAINLLRKLVT